MLEVRIIISMVHKVKLAGMVVVVVAVAVVVVEELQILELVVLHWQIEY